MCAVTRGKVGSVQPVKRRSMGTPGAPPSAEAALHAQLARLRAAVAARGPPPTGAPATSPGSGEQAVGTFQGVLGPALLDQLRDAKPLEHSAELAEQLAAFHAAVQEAARGAAAAAPSPQDQGTAAASSRRARNRKVYQSGEISCEN